jgi:RNA polymerase sigma factor (sigma-70 family)
MGENEDPFEIFLSWLSSDRDEAEKKFKALRHRLVVLLELRGCTPAEDLADEAILRFIRRLPAMLDTFKTEDPIPYLLTTARNLHLDYLQQQPLPLPDDMAEWPQPDDDPGAEEEQHHKCLDKCLEGLRREERESVLAYYQWEHQAKIKTRKALADRMGISANALRIRIYHIKVALQACIEQCLGLKPPAEME